MGWSYFYELGDIRLIWMGGIKGIWSFIWFVLYGGDWGNFGINLIYSKKIVGNLVIVVVCL